MECKYNEFLVYGKPKEANFVKNSIKTSILGAYLTKNQVTLTT